VLETPPEKNFKRFSRKKIIVLPSQPKNSGGAPGKAKAPEFLNRIFDGSQFSEI